MNKPRYILFGNAESVHLLKWAKELSRYFELFIISPIGVHEQMKNVVPESNIYALNLKINPEGGNFKLLTKIFRFKKIIKKIKPDIVNAHYLTSHGFIAALIRKYFGGKFILIQSAWGSDVLVTPKRNSLYRCITRFTLNNATLATSDSNYMSSVMAVFSFTKCLTFPFGLDAMPEASFEEKDPDLFFSNRALTENYHIEKIIYAFAVIAMKNINAKLIISNDGPKRKELTDLVKNIGMQDRVEFKGFLAAKDQNEIYKKATYYFSLPASDSTSVSLLEAMAYGCVPILSDLPANREWIQNKKNGTIYTSKEGFFSDLPDTKIAFEENRKIISQRAIFSENIKTLVDLLYANYLKKEK